MLEELPPEIFLQILDNLDSKSAYASLARASRDLYHYMKPLLYKSIETPCYCVGIHKSLVHTLLRYPVLAKSVRHVRLGKLKYRTHADKYREHKHEYVESSESNERLVQAVQDLSHSAEKYTRWMTDLKKEYHRDPWLAILLYILPNIETLELCWGGAETQYSGRLFEGVIGKSAPSDKKLILQNLHSITIKVAKHETKDFSIKSLRPFFQLQTLRTFKGQFIADRGLTFATHHTDKSNIESPITHLELQQCHSENGFIELIAPCKNLKTFIYTQQEQLNTGHQFMTTGTSSYGLRFGYLKPTPFARSLATKKHTLESVTMDIFRREKGDYSNDWRIMNWIADGTPQFNTVNFSDFNHLRHLHIRARSFVGTGLFEGPPPLGRSLVEILPGSIETLWISIRQLTEEILDEMVYSFEEPPMDESRSNPDMDCMTMHETLSVLSVKERFANLVAVTIEGENFVDKEMKKALKKNIRPLENIYPYYSGLLNSEKVAWWEPLRVRCIELGVKFSLRDRKLEMLVEDIDDPLIFDKHYASYIASNMKQW